jgi:Enoyl-(Acyl carrier protein) reductase
LISTGCESSITPRLFSFCKTPEAPFSGHSTLEDPPYCSVAGIRYTGVPYSTYYATKAAMIHLTRTTAVQYAPKHIRVNAVLPGLMKTPMVEKTAGLAAEYGKRDIEEMWKVRDAQGPMGHMGDAWDATASANNASGFPALPISGRRCSRCGAVPLRGQVLVFQPLPQSTRFVALCRSQ